MWSNKKQDKPPPADPGLTNVQTNQSLKPAPASWEGTTKTSKDAMRPTEATSECAPSRLGSSLHLKGEISGNEDLDIDGIVEGLVDIDKEADGRSYSKVDSRHHCWRGDRVRKREG